MPDRLDITEEGFGYFRGTWFIGRTTFSEAREVLDAEEVFLDWADDHATEHEEFELLATFLEKLYLAPDQLLRLPDVVVAQLRNFEPTLEQENPLCGLELGVAGITITLASIQCLTAASCRSHFGKHSWADGPVVFFAAPAWRVEILAEMVEANGCGLGQGRDMLFVYGDSVLDMHSLARSIIRERDRFKKNPSAPPRSKGRVPNQLNLFDS